MTTTKPEALTLALLRQRRDEIPAVAAKHGASNVRIENPPALDEVRRVDLDERPSLQTLHIGPYEAEGASLERLHSDHMPALGLVANGHHHEIYLSDPRRTESQRLCTILRQPIPEA